MKMLQLGQLFALPLQSAIRAQNLAIQETISFIEQFGTEQGTAKTFRFKAERLVEERAVDTKTGEGKTQFTVQPFEINIPLLALVPTPTITLREMDVEFGVEVVEAKSEPIKSSVIPLSALGSSLASSLSLFSPLSQSNPTTLKVHMKLVKEVPEGLARLGDILTDLLCAKASQAELKVPKTLHTVARILGISIEMADALKAKGIQTVKEFLSTTETEEGIKDIAKNIGVSKKSIIDWREKSLTLSEENG